MYVAPELDYISSNLADLLSGPSYNQGTGLPPVPMP